MNKTQQLQARIDQLEAAAKQVVRGALGSVVVQAPWNERTDAELAEHLPPVMRNLYDVLNPQ